MTFEEYLEILSQVVFDNRRHEGYDKKKKIAQWLLSINTGKYQGDIIVSYRSRETKEQKEQRIKVYNSRTQMVANKARSFYHEVHRTDDAMEVLSYSDDAEERGVKQKLIEQISDFYGGISVREYLSKKQIEKNFFDPNAWLVVEWRNEGVNTPNQYFPYLVDGVDVLDFRYDYGRLEYVVTRKKEKYKGKDDYGYSYTIYGVGWSIVMYPEKRGFEYESMPDDVIEHTQDRKKAYYKSYDNGLDEVQAYPFGYIEDPECDSIRHSPLHIAEEGFKRLINHTATYDVSIACHGFLQKFIYAMPCNHVEEKDGQHFQCIDGLIGDHRCRECKGSGMQIHTSDQDVVYFKLPDIIDDGVVKLSDLVYYAQIDHETVRYQKEEVESAARDCLKTIFNEDVFERNEVTQTATESMLNWRSVYNTLAPYADHDAQMYEFIVRIIAKASGISEGLTHSFKYPSDFHMESVQELVNLANSIPEGKLAPEILQSINLQIVKKLTTDDPIYIENYKAKERFRPFSDIPDSQLFLLLDSLPPDHPKKILFYNFNDIFMEIFERFPEFGTMGLPEQKKALDQVISEFSQNDSVIKVGETQTYNFGD